LGFATAGALIAAALVAVSPGRATAATPCTRTFSSGTINEPIDTQVGDLFGVLSDIDVPEDGAVVTDVDVAVDIRHSTPSDLTILLVSDSPTLTHREVATLFVRQDPGGAGDDLRGTVFDDAADKSITTATAPFTGRFAPVEPLSRMNEYTGGSYRLSVRDVTRGGGTLVSWTLTLTFRDCDADEDGVLLSGDSCPRMWAPTGSGCPSAARAVTAKSLHGKLRGALSSPVAGCKAGRAVSIFRVRPGADRRVGTATTRADGSWRLARAKKKGRYYATSPRVVVPDAAECPAVKSRAFRVR
jgi:subtilisin-like proprotein convertase family protein